MSCTLVLLWNEWGENKLRFWNIVSKRGRCVVLGCPGASGVAHAAVQAYVFSFLKEQ